ncbi:hypothetical protein BDV29DRAFT_162374 [Aspergillus leporis]|uniref:Ecp2 effector protein domain-containing protein n=1 Tax=Aspergillus leporis TaxID=41062 RepID=A0A5N5WJ05_9EURO|nr:hypothetical protein BDV29DRAFT_162374 [Aspergillus leporis]
MHWKNLITVITLLATSQTTSALSAARIKANFSPRCPADDHSSYPEDPNLALHEEFTTAIDIVANKCEEIPVPLRYNPETSHISIDAELFWQDTLDQCNITVWELPGCSAGPIFSKEISNKKAAIECQPRQMPAFSQVWLKLECERMKPVHHGIASWYHGRLSDYTEGDNSTGRFNSTVVRDSTQGSNSSSLRKRWEDRLGRLLPFR